MEHSRPLPATSTSSNLFSVLTLQTSRTRLSLLVTHIFFPPTVITQREMVSRLIRENLSRRAARFNLVLDDVSLTHVGFSPAFSEAVESKQIAQQTAQRAAFLVDQAIQEKQSIIVRAQGEAKSAELIGQAIKQNKGFLTLRRLEAAREIANVVSGSGNKVILDADSLLLNVNSDETYGVAEDAKSSSKLRR